MGQAPTMRIPQRLPLLIDPQNRYSSTNKDAKLVNCYAEVDHDRNLNIYRRPGMLEWGIPPATNASGQGVFFWNDAVYSVFNGVLYKGLTQVATGLDATGGVYSFSSIMGATPKMVLQNGVQGYSYADTPGLSATLHSINTSYPQYTCKGWAYLNGAQYVLQKGGSAQPVFPAVVWGSKVNSVDQAGDWDALDYITAQIEPDSGVALAKQLVYVICLKEWSTEVFYDVGNATGSPLQNAENAKITYGCASADSVQNINEILFWISNNRSASNQVVMLENLQLKVVSTPEIDRLLNQADLSTVYSWQIKLNGHSFYVLTIKNANLTLAYDWMQNRWCQWTDVSGNYVPIVSSCRDSSGNHILQHETNGTLYYASSNYLDDNGSIIPITIVTPGFDAGTRRRKMLGAMTFVGDQVPGSLLYVQVSDDDYQTWSQPRVVDLGINSPRLHNCGSFAQRGFKFTVNNNLPFRLSAVELQFDIGLL